MIRNKYQDEIEWLFAECESAMGVRSNFNSFIVACKLGSSRKRTDDQGQLVNGAQEDVENELIDAIDSRKAMSRTAATAKNRRIMAAYCALHTSHQRVFEAAFEARQAPPEVRKVFGYLAGVVPLTVSSRAITGYSTEWLAKAIVRGDGRVSQLRKEAERLFNDALTAYQRARGIASGDDTNDRTEPPVTAPRRQRAASPAKLTEAVAQ